MLAAEAKLLSMSGAVEVRPAREGEWVSATDSMEIPEGGAIRTGAGGMAVMQLPNKSKVWLKENSSLEIEQRQTFSSRLALIFGKIKVRVPHLMRKERFEIRTQAAICAVRGTEFTMGANEEGKLDLQVLFGEVKFKFTIPPAKGPTQFNIPQGQGLTTAEEGKANKPVLLTAKAEREAMENWNPGLKPEERQKELQQKENDRAQIKDFARTTTNAENAVKNFLNVVKESDLEAGRTLKDVHGNTVRVDQRMVRPDANTIQFMNLVKRPSYADFTKPANGFTYNGGAVANRLDYMQMNMGFNTALPARIEEWPSFFNSNSIKPTYASFIMAQKEPTGIFFVAQPYLYIASRDELINNEQTLGLALADDRDIVLTGFLTNDSVNNISAVEGLNRIARLEVTNDGAVTGGLKYTSDNTTKVGVTAGDVVWAQRLTTANGGLSYNMDAEDIGSDQLWSYNAERYGIGGQAGTKIWLAQESYVINNGGAIQTKNNIVSSGTDPFTLLKNVAGETVFYVKNDNPGGNSTYNKISPIDRIGTSNIDLVFIPDLMVAAVQRMLPAITSLGE